MERLDPRKVSLTEAEFTALEFSTHGLPAVSFELATLLSGYPPEKFAVKKMKAHNQTKRRNARQYSVLENKRDPKNSEEWRDTVRLKQQHPDANFDLFEFVFRSLSLNPQEPHDYELQASYESLKKGLSSKYYHLPSPFLSQLIFGFLSDNCSNHTITYPEFVQHVMLPLQFDPNYLAFRMLDSDRDGKLSIVNLLYLYVNLPSKSSMVGEIT